MIRSQGLFTSRLFLHTCIKKVAPLKQSPDPLVVRVASASSGTAGAKVVEVEGEAPLLQNWSAGMALATKMPLGGFPKLGVLFGGSA